MAIHSDGIRCYKFVGDAKIKRVLNEKASAFGDNISSV